MTPSEVIRLAREAGFEKNRCYDVILRHSNGSWINCLEQVERLISLAKAEALAEGWQPIETAPKDGTEFDAWNGKERVPNVFWAVPEYATDGERTWCTWEYITGFGHEAHTAHCLTHWRPLPPPPKEAP